MARLYSRVAPSDVRYQASPRHMQSKSLMQTRCAKAHGGATKQIRGPSPASGTLFYILFFFFSIHLPTPNWSRHRTAFFNLIHFINLLTYCFINLLIYWVIELYIIWLAAKMWNVISEIWFFNSIQAVSGRRLARYGTKTRKPREPLGPIYPLRARRRPGRVRIRRISPYLLDFLLFVCILFLIFSFP